MVAIVLGGTAWLMRPRLGRVPRENLVSREDATELYSLVDDVAAALGTTRVDVIVVSADYNASWEVVGLRRRRVLTLGLPLLAALGPHERVALVAHELAHGRNGDSRRGLFVGSAVGALEELSILLAPEAYTTSSELGIIEPVVNAILWVLSLPPRALLLLEMHLLLHDMQRAEYLADALAAEVAGTDAVVAAHEKLLLGSILDSFVRRSLQLREAEPGDLFVDLRALLAAVPERERERRRRVARLEETRLDVTHPATGHRISLLEDREAVPARVALSAERSAAIDAELKRFEPGFGQQIFDSARDALYYR